MQCTEGTSHYQPGDKAWRSNPNSPHVLPLPPASPPPLLVSGTSFQGLCPSKQPHSLRLDGLMVESVGLMGTRIAGVDVTAYKNNKLVLSSMLIQNKQALAVDVFGPRRRGILINTRNTKSCYQERNIEPKPNLSFVVKNLQQHTSRGNATDMSKISWSHQVHFCNISKAKWKLCF